VKETPLGRVDDIADGGSAGLNIDAPGGRRFYLAVRRGRDVHVYVNSCPHLGSPLDFTPGRFLNLEKTHILCATHGALFRIEDGYCVSGPCAGKSLRAAPFHIRDGVILLSD
jgi:nitrite reductase/ring-hydroxylating ferredoxin subunit